MYEDQLCLWFLKPAQLKALLVLDLTDGPRVIPIPMDCLRICTDLWTPDLGTCIYRGRGGFVTDRIISQEVIPLCPGLTSLDLYNSGVEDESIKKIGYACLKLTSVNLGSTRVTDHGISAIARNCPLLTSLDVSHTCFIGDYAIEVVADHCPALTSLNVSCTRGEITDKSIKAIVASCRALTFLDVSLTRGAITNEGLKGISASCKVKKDW